MKYLQSHYCSMLRKVFFIAFIGIWILLPTKVRAAELATDLKASLIWVAPGKNLYTAHGHCAIRMECPSEGLDFCFTYGLDDDSQSIVAFFRGKGLGNFSVSHTNEYLQDYRRDGRKVQEYELNLSLDQKRMLWAMLDGEISDGAWRRYDYLRTNCSSMCVRIIETALGEDRIELQELSEGLQGTYREFVSEISSDSPWVKFFWLSLLGADGEKKGELEDKLSPTMLVETWDKASIIDTLSASRPVFLSEPQTLVEGSMGQASSPFTPTMGFSILLVFVAMITFLEQRGRYPQFAACVDFVLLVLQTIVGVFLCYMNFISSLPGASGNWYVIPFNPLPFLAWACLRKRHCYVWIWKVFTLILIVFLLLTPLLPSLDLDHALLVATFTLRAVAYTHKICKQQREKDNFKKKNMFFLFQILAFIAIMCAPQRMSAQALKVHELKCENLVAPLGIDNTKPHFSWKNKGMRNSARQTAYELQVGYDSVSVASGVADLWKSGKQRSEESVMVAYGGKALHSGDLCYWRVRTWDEKGRVSKWSDISRFSVGLLQEKDFKGQYIGLSVESGDTGAPVLFRNIVLSDVRTTFVHVNSLGYHELSVNGQKVGRAVLMPAVSQLDKRSLIVTYDITPYLRPGDNQICIALGRGWYRSTIFHNAGDAPLVRADICELASSGMWKVIAATDSTWSGYASGYHDTGTWYALHFGGERVDGRVLLNTAKPIYPTVTVSLPEMKATPQMCEPNFIIDTLRVERMVKEKDGSLLLDFGRVITGWLSLNLKSLPKGQEIKMEYADWLVDTLGFQSQGESDSYVAAGVDNELFQNKFHHHAFRYVRITGLLQTLRPADAKALQLSGGYQETAQFWCDDDDMNAIETMMKRTMRCLTFSGYMVDCPHLERMGYGGDGQSSLKTLNNYCAAAPTYYNWMQAWDDAWDDAEGLPYVAPAGGGGGGPYWCAFVVKASWEVYRYHADARILHRHYNLMKRWLTYARRYMKEGLLQPWPDNSRRIWWLGDWLAPAGVDVGGESPSLVNNCVLSDCLATLSRIARLLDKDSESKEFALEQQQLNKRIHETFFHTEDTTYATGSLLDMAYPMIVGATPEALKEQVNKKLVSRAYLQYHGHIAGGLVGVAVFARWAVENNAATLVHDMLKKSDYPGYLYMIANGATTTWEYWNGERSHVHNCYNGIGAWFYEALAGIRPVDDYAGYRRILIHPQCPTGIHEVKATRETPYGTVRVHWKDTMLDVVVPVGITADVVWQGVQKTVGSGSWTFGCP